jgi:HEAT repeat protein
MGLRKTHTPEALREVLDREHPRTADGLLAQLQRGDAEQRRWAARDLAQHPATSAALGTRLLAEPDRSVRQALFTSLAAHGGAAAADALLPLLRSEDAELRNSAIEALSAMPAAVAPRVDALLHDADADVRIFTVNLLGELRHPQVRPWLLAVLRHDTAVNVVAAALEVMAEVGEPADEPALRAVATRFASDAFIGFAATMAADRVRAD